jgi:hypothetical protein
LDKHTYGNRIESREGKKVKFKQKIEWIIEDVNDEKGFTLTFVSQLLQNHFRMIILAGIPFLFYIFLLAGELQ